MPHRSGVPLNEFAPSALATASGRPWYDRARLVAAVDGGLTTHARFAAQRAALARELGIDVQFLFVCRLFNNLLKVLMLLIFLECGQAYYEITTCWYCHGVQFRCQRGRPVRR